MIVLVGDTHGEIDHKNLNNEKILKACDGKYPEYAIVLGDFGFIWSNKKDDTEKYWINWLDKKPWTTLFLPGNHENYDRLLSDEFPDIAMFGATVKQISKKVFMLLTGNIYEIDGATYFVYGGAQSTDKEYRRPYMEWWPEETPGQNDFMLACNNLNGKNWKVDYVLTHTLPQELKAREGLYMFDATPCPVALALDHFYENLTYDHWFCGHFHIDKDIDKKHSVLYNNVITIE